LLIEPIGLSVEYKLQIQRLQTSSLPLTGRNSVWTGLRWE